MATEEESTKTTVEEEQEEPSSSIPPPPEPPIPIPTTIISSADNARCFFDILIPPSTLPSRLIFELFTSITPKTCENFRQLCNEENKLSYKNTKFTRIIKNFTIQCGMIWDEDEQKYVNQSIYGECFDGKLHNTTFI